MPVQAHASEYRSAPLRNLVSDSRGSDEAEVESLRGERMDQSQKSEGSAEGPLSEECAWRKKRLTSDEDERDAAELLQCHG